MGAAGFSLLHDDRNCWWYYRRRGFVRYCDATNTAGIGSTPPKFPTPVENFRNLIRERPEVLKCEGDSYRDPRVRYVFVMAPALGAAFPISGLKKIGSAQQSARKSNLRGFLESDVFVLEECPMAASHQNGQNP